MLDQALLRVGGHGFLGRQASLGICMGCPGLSHPSADWSRMLTAGAASLGGWGRVLPPNADPADLLSLPQRTETQTHLEVSTGDC